MGFSSPLPSNMNISSQPNNTSHLTNQQTISQPPSHSPNNYVSSQNHQPNLSLSHIQKSSSGNVSSQPESTRGRVLTYEDLSRCFHLPINTAARELGVCVTALKKQCRRHGVPRWPHRKLKSLDKLKEKLEKEEATAADKEYYKHEIHSIVQKKDHIFRSNPTTRDPYSSNDNITNTSKSTSVLTDLPNNPQRYANFVSSDPTALPAPSPFMPIPLPMPPRNPNLHPTHPTHPSNPMHPQSLATIPLTAPHVSICGIFGCDCYLNGGVSSQNYHLPLPPRPPPNVGPSNPLITNTQPPTSSAVPGNQNTPFYHPPTYPYSAHLSYPASLQPPFHNMVQVNVMDQQLYGHPPNRVINTSQSTASQPPSAPISTSMAPNGHHPPTRPNQSQSPSVSAQLPTTSMSQPSYDSYAHAHASNGGQPPNNFIYGGFPGQHQIPIDSIHQQGTLPTGQIVPNYWTDMGHSTNPNQLVTMFQHSTHYHHHHATETPNGGQSNIDDSSASTATNNSNAAKSQRKEINRNPMAIVPVNGRHEEGANSPNQLVSNSKLSKDKIQKSKTRQHNVPNGNVHEQMKRPQASESIRTSGMQSRNERLNSNGRENPSSQRKIQKGAVSNSAAQTEMKDSYESNQEGTKHSRNKDNTTEKGKDSHHSSKMGANRHISRNERQSVSNNELKKRSNAELRNNGIRTSNKRPRNESCESPEKGKSEWEDSYFTAGNTGVPAVLHATNGNGSVREITPPTDREETPDYQNDTGSGSGTGADVDDAKTNLNGSSCGTNRKSEEPKETNVGNSRRVETEDRESRKNMIKKDEQVGGNGYGDVRDPPSPSVRNIKETQLEPMGWHLPDGVSWGEGTTNTCSGESDTNGEKKHENEKKNSTMVRARRYEKVVNHCVSLSCAQWCTDKNLQITISLGSKALLRLAGVGSHGGMVCEEMNEMIESKHSMRMRYNSAVKGQRMEWLATNGRKRYLVVLGPRKRNGSEIVGVSGLLMELKQLQQL